MVFPPRLCTSRDMFETFSLQVQNKGPNARIKLKDMYYRNAIASISTNVEVAVVPPRASGHLWPDFRRWFATASTALPRH